MIKAIAFQKTNCRVFHSDIQICSFKSAGDKDPMIEYFWER